MASPSSPSSSSNPDSTVVNLQQHILELNKKIAELTNNVNDLKSSTTSSPSSSTSGDSKSSDKSSPSREFGLFISDIARGTTDEQLKVAFEQIVPVYSATVVKNKQTGDTKGYGFVQLYSMDDVYKALDYPNLPSFQDKVSGRMQTVKITIADPKNTLYIGNIPRVMGEEEVKQAIQEIGQVSVLKFELSIGADGTSRGFGWATYRNHDSAIHSMRLLQRSELGGSPLTVSLAEPRAFDQRILDKVKTLFAKGVPNNATPESLQSLFGRDVVERAVIPLDGIKRTPLGHAFIHFKTRSDAEKALNQFQGYEVDGRKLSLEWCLPQGTKKSKKKVPPSSDSSLPPPTWPYYYWHDTTSSSSGSGSSKRSKSSDPNTSRDSSVPYPYYDYSSYAAYGTRPPHSGRSSSSNSSSVPYPYPSYTSSRNSQTGDDYSLYSSSSNSAQSYYDAYYGSYSGGGKHQRSRTDSRYAPY